MLTWIVELVKKFHVLMYFINPPHPFSLNRFWYFTQDLLRTIEPLENNRKWVWYVYKQHNNLALRARSWISIQDLPLGYYPIFNSWHKHLLYKTLHACTVYEGVVSYSWLLEIKSMTHFLASLSNILVLYACALFSKIEHYFMLIISGLSNKQTNRNKQN